MVLLCRAKTFTKSLLVAASAATILLGASAVQAKDKSITFGTASASGVYNPVGGAICMLVQDKANEHGIRCSVETTGGSIYNLNVLRQNEMDVAFAQSDWQYASYLGEGVFADMGPDKNLRSLFSLHSEALTLVVGKDSGIKTLDDLKGKRFNLGNPGSGTRSTVEELLKAKGWDHDAFSLAGAYKTLEVSQKLCDNQIDAFAFNAGHPNGTIPEAKATCGAVIIPVQGPEVDKLVNTYSYYAPATIPGNMYTGNPDDIPTYGVKATIVSSSEVDDEIIYHVVKAVFDNMESFKTVHPILSNLNKESMITDGLTAPLHEGAKRYYQEVGLLPADE